MPAQRKPTKMLELNGAYKKDPQRRRPPEPEVKEPLGNAPDYFNEAELLAWKQIAAWAPEGVITQADRVTVEQCAQLVAEMREKKRDFSVSKINSLAKFLGLLGMTPVDRSRIGVTKEKPKNDFDGF